MTHAVSDLIIRIKNGYLARRETIEVIYSKFAENILQKLAQLKYIKEYKTEKDNHRIIKVELIYNNELPAVTDVKIFSKPGRRYYSRSKKLKPVLSGMGFSILSTPKGIMTNIEAKKARMGGELLFQIW